MQNIIEIKNLKKVFGAKTVVNGISFGVKKHSLFAFLGQNGAGKTTTINIIIGLLHLSGGEILYDGSSDFAAFKNKIGVVFQNNISDDLLTVKENLLTLGALYIKPAKKAKERLDEIIKLLSLEDILKQRFKTLSGGQKRKVEIARALFMSPEILFLDEPTTGLDPKTRAEIWSIINKLKTENGMTIFLTTHYMEEAATADNVAIINKGNIIAVGSPTELKTQYAFDRLLITPKNEKTLEQKLEARAIKWQKTADVYIIRLDGAEDFSNGAKDSLSWTKNSIGLLYDLKDNIRFYEVIKGSMDDVFLNVIEEKRADEEYGTGQNVDIQGGEA